MTIDDKTKYWLDIAHYDFVSAKAMLESKRFLYVGFLCHQTIEKCLKAFYCYKQKKEPPYTHNLLVLLEKCGLTEHESEKYIPLFNELMPLNIQARYPEDKSLLLKSLNLKKSQELYVKTKDFYLWIKKLLK